MPARGSSPLVSIHSILLDADGVIQLPSPEWRRRLEALVPDQNRADEFLAELFAAERPCITGEQDFGLILEDILQRWQCGVSAGDVLDIWTLIEPSHEVLELVSELKQQGHRVCLATNQQRHRARYMSDVLGYDALFDASFYSCDVGHAKPDRSYFLHMMEKLDAKAGELLFIDDKDANVAVARDLGIHAEQFHLMEGAEVLRERLRIHRIEV